jgi:hypothetical protein
MANARDLLKQVLNKQDDILRVLKDQEARIAALEDDTLDFELSYQRVPTPRATETQPDADQTAELPPPPAEWGNMTTEQRQAWVSAHTGISIPQAEGEWESADIGTGSEVRFPKPSEHAKDQWAKQAPQIFENLPSDWPLGKDEAADAYRKGGPLWLAAYGQAGHKWFMSLPHGFRVAMVATVSEYAPQSAIELGRDVLRVPTDQQQGRAYDVGLDHADARDTAHA